MEALTIVSLQDRTKDFCRALSDELTPELYEVNDGKTVGTFVEHRFRDFLANDYEFEAGTSAMGIDFPGLNQLLSSGR